MTNGAVLIRLRSTDHVRLVTLKRKDNHNTIVPALLAAGIEKFRCYPETCVGSNPMLTLHCGREAKCSSSGGGRLLVAVESLSDLVYIRFDS